VDGVALCHEVIRVADGDDRHAFPALWNDRASLAEEDDPTSLERGPSE
jgi:hypothetical protein